MATLGSLFDGIGGFPWSAIRHGIQPIWASEIETWPTKVTQQNFPCMKHLGDITRINGADIEPVDVITFGSPCQDLSVAGKREGLDGARSGLFMDAVRIIRQMRESTGGKRPRFAVWENVPGAFSSNKGQDFWAVLQEIGEAEIPMPESGKWANAGMVRTETADIAWRTIDAQYWGVPQRRRRIFLVADFGGRCAGEILFKRESVSGDFETGGEAGEEAAATTGDGVTEPNCLTPWDCQSKRIYGENSKWPTLYSGEGGGAKNQAVLLRSQDGVCRVHMEGIVPTLNTQQGGQRQPCVLSPAIVLNDQGGSQIDVSENVVGTLRAEAHGNVPAVCAGFNGYKSISGSIQYKEESAATLESNMPGNVVAGYRMTAFGEYADDDMGSTVKARDFKDATDLVVSGLDIRNLKENGDISGTLQAKKTGGYSLNYTHPVRQGYLVRRLTPLECLRLQGFPDWWLDIEGMADTQKYKAIGNSVAIPCVDFVMSGIAEALREGTA